MVINFLSKNILFVGLDWERKEVFKRILTANLRIVGYKHDINSTNNCNVIGKIPLADKLIELLDSPKKADKFGSYGYNKILSKYTWDNVDNLIKQNIDKTLDKDRV